MEECQDGALLSWTLAMLLALHDLNQTGGLELTDPDLAARLQRVGGIPHVSLILCYGRVNTTRKDLWFSTRRHLWDSNPRGETPSA